MKNNSLISAKATQQANGGNTQINANFIIAFPQNNDIIASAKEGQGGNINISTNAIFGIKERPAIPFNNTNDIDASSQFGLDGNISIDILEFELAQSLTELPENIVDASRLITKSCLAGDEKNEFVATGRGGLPTNPNESLRGDKVSDLLYRCRRSLNPLVSQIPINGFEASLSQKELRKVSDSLIMP